MTQKTAAAQAGESAAPEKAKTEEVTLTASHTHVGKDCKAGEKIQVTERQKAFLQESKKIGGSVEPVKES